MRVFDEPNLGGGWTCPICGTAENKPVVLVGISGTEQGRNMQAEQVHLDCIDLRMIYRPDHGVRALVQFLDEEEA